MSTLPCLPAWVLCVALGLGGSPGNPPAAPTPLPGASWAGLELTWPEDSLDEGLCVTLALERRQTYALCVRRPAAAAQSGGASRTDPWRVSFRTGAAPGYPCVYAVLAIAGAPAARTIAAALPPVCTPPASQPRSHCLAAQAHTLLLRFWI